MNCRFPEHENIKYEFSTNKKSTEKVFVRRKTTKKMNRIKIQENGSIVADVGLLFCVCVYVLLLNESKIVLVCMGLKV